MQGTRSSSLFKTSSFDMNNSDGQASLERQKSPEITTDTQDVSKFCGGFGAPYRTE